MKVSRSRSALMLLLASVGAWTLADDTNPTHVLQVVVNLPTGSTDQVRVVSQPAGIDCPSWQSCAAVFPHGTLVRLRGRSGGSPLRVVGWAGAACEEGTNATDTCTVLMDAGKYEQANFWAATPAPEPSPSPSPSPRPRKKPHPPHPPHPPRPVNR